ncbi:MAG: Hdr-like menaquinol oxidoreductase cytochrome c subunit [Arenicellales bacterium]
MHLLHILKALFMTAMLMAAIAANAEIPRPEVVKAEGKCVEPTDVMRRNHMEFILHQRDETVHEGIRTSKHSFKQCISCHAVKDDQGEYVSVDDSRHFCVTCHEYTAVNIDCFQCHADTPRSTDKHELRVNE